jgi:hypothetical protein
MPKTYAVDYDGVIHRYSKGWHDGTCYDPPVDGAFDRLAQLLEHGAVYIHTTRDPLQIGVWLDQNGKLFDWVTDTELPSWTAPGLTPPEWDGQFWNRQDMLLITNRKLPAVTYIDDRAVRFHNWNQTWTELEIRGYLQ